jgi:uncharacterized membrane protein YqjE
MSTETDRVASDPPLELPAAPSVGDLVQAASAQLSTLLRAEIELAKAEMSATVKRAAVGAGLLSAAAAVLLIALPFFLIFIAELLVDPVGLPRWSAYLIVWAVFLIIAGVLAMIGLRTMRRMRKPERTIETVKETARWARHPTEAGSDR